MKKASVLAEIAVKYAEGGQFPQALETAKMMEDA